MLQDTQAIRHYQKLTDDLTDLWNRGYRTDDLRLFLDGYLAALRTAGVMEPHEIHRLEAEASRFLYDASNFAIPEPELDYDLP